MPSFLGLPVNVLCNIVRIGCLSAEDILNLRLTCKYLNSIHYTLSAVAIVKRKFWLDITDYNLPLHYCIIYTDCIYHKIKHGVHNSALYCNYVRGILCSDHPAIFKFDISLNQSIEIRSMLIEAIARDRENAMLYYQLARCIDIHGTYILYGNRKMRCLDLIYHAIRVDPRFTQAYDLLIYYAKYESRVERNTYKRILTDAIRFNPRYHKAYTELVRILHGNEVVEIHTMLHKNKTDLLIDAIGYGSDDAISMLCDIIGENETIELNDGRRCNRDMLNDML